MDCKKIQEYLLTDYLDGRLDKKETAAIDKHIASCSDCRRFAGTVKKHAHEPFTMAENKLPDESVWINIRNAVEDDVHPRTDYQPQAGWFERFSGLFTPKQAFGLAVCSVIILVAVSFSTIMKSERIAGQGDESVQLVFNEESDSGLDASLIESMEYLAYLDEESDTDYGTGIEEYFL